MTFLCEPLNDGERKTRRQQLSILRPRRLLPHLLWHPLVDISLDWGMKVKFTICSANGWTTYASEGLGPFDGVAAELYIMWKKGRCHDPLVPSIPTTEKISPEIRWIRTRRADDIKDITRSNEIGCAPTNGDEVRRETHRSSNKTDTELRATMMWALVRLKRES